MLIACLVCILYPSAQTYGTESVKTGAAIGGPDLSKHPIYSTYDFGEPSQVINFGTQPLAVPIGVIGEMIKRDNILKKTMQEKGIEIRFHPFLKGADLNFFFKRGQIDAAMGGDMPTMTLASEFDIMVAALVKQGSSELITNKDIQLWDLKGRRIGYPPNSNAHRSLLVALSSVGLKASDVQMIPLDINQMTEALHNGKIDAFSAWEPIPTLALTRYDNLVSIHKDLNESYLFFNRAMLSRHPDIAHHLVASLVRAVACMKKSHNNLLEASRWSIEAGKPLQERVLVPTAEQIADITTRDLLDLISFPAIPEKNFMLDGPLHEEFEFLATLGNIPPSIKWERIAGSLDRTIIREVVSKAEKYRIYEFDYESGGGGANN